MDRAFTPRRSCRYISRLKERVPPMAATAPLSLDSTPALRARTGSRVRPFRGPAFDWAMAGTAVWIVVGLFVDGWAHNHLLSTRESFFTPWHGLLYSGVGAAMGVLVAGATRNHAAGYSWREALPSGYALSFLCGVL